MPTTGGGNLPEPELDRFSNILQAFNGLCSATSPGRTATAWARCSPKRSLPRWQPTPPSGTPGRNSDDANARIEHDSVQYRIVTGMVKDDAELSSSSDNEDFRRWTATVF